MQGLSLLPLETCDFSLLAARANHALLGLSRIVPLRFLGALLGSSMRLVLQFMFATAKA